MSLLPSKPDTSSAVDEAEPRVVGVESDDADDLLGALSSDTARSLLAQLHEEPAPPAELAERADTSLQNAQYHLEKLEDAGVVTVVDTAYSEKGREMEVYAPADQPLVIYAGDQNTSTSLRSALARLLGGFGLLALGSLAIQETLGGGLDELFGTAGSSGGPAGGAATGTDAAAAKTSTPGGASTPDPSGTPDAVGGAARTTADAVSGGAVDAATSTTPPGLVFFLGGATVLCGALLAWYLWG